MDPPFHYYIDDKTNETKAKIRIRSKLQYTVPNEHPVAQVPSLAVLKAQISKGFGSNQRAQSNITV